MLPSPRLGRVKIFPTPMLRIPPLRTELDFLFAILFANKKKKLLHLHQYKEPKESNLSNMETMQTDLKFKDKQPAFERMQHLSELSAMTKDESDQYFMEQDYYRTIKNADDYEYEQAQLEATMRIAKNLKQSGVDSPLIAQATGLTEEEVSKL